MNGQEGELSRGTWNTGTGSMPVRICRESLFTVKPAERRSKQTKKQIKGKMIKNIDGTRVF